MKPTFNISPSLSSSSSMSPSLFLLASLLSSFLLPTQPAPQPATVKIGFIADINTTLGKTSRLCINMSATDFYAGDPNTTTKLIFIFRNSDGDVVRAATSTLDLIENEKVDAIVGPQTSGEAAFVAELGTKFDVPVVTFSATSPAVSPSQTPFFVRAAPDDAAQSAAIAAIVKALGWRALIPIYDEDEGGAAFVPSLVDALDGVDVRVPYRVGIKASFDNDEMAAQLEELMAMQTRVFLVHASPPLAARIFSAAEATGMMTDGYAWIATSEVMAGGDLSGVSSGVIGVRAYVPDSPRLRDFRQRWRREYPELSIAGIRAYDAVWAVATAVEAAGGGSGGRKLLDSILEATFAGLGGEFRLVGGELSVAAFEVVNVVGGEGTRIGFWTPAAGLSKDLAGAGGNGVGYSALKEDLAAVKWPGGAAAAPRGWEPPTPKMKMRVVVPAIVDFDSFVDVGRDPATGMTVATGFVIDVFEAAVRQLPYELPFTYIAVNAVDYNQLAYDLFLKKYDAVVGGIAMTANRTQYAGFTTPYTVTGISMVVPIQDQKGSTTWVFLKPWTLDLWLAAGAFLLLTGLVVYVLEHRVNPEFRGPPANQLGVVFYFAFSTMVFSHNGNIVSNLGRIVVVTWVIAVLILQSSYTASLASMLTVQQLTAPATTMSDLISSKGYVGCREGSFVRGFLLSMGFDASRIRTYTSPEEYARGLALGSDSGGVAAIIDEVPYLRIFLKDYCSNYTMTGDVYMTGGFSFAFQKGSPIIDDLTTAILKITESGQMSDIEKKWLGEQNSCPSDSGSTGSSSSSDGSGSLDFKSFWGLFLITGIILVVAFCTYWACFFYKHRSRLGSFWAADTPLGRRFRAIAELFDQKDLSSHTFREMRMSQSMKESAASTSMPKDLQSQPSFESYKQEDN